MENGNLKSRKFLMLLLAVGLASAAYFLQKVVGVPVTSVEYYLFLTGSALTYAGVNLLDKAKKIVTDQEPK